ncbi:hypothetical protein ACS0TY_008986 [Phlomoides rotata]
MAWDTDYRYEPTPLFESTFRCLPFSKYSNPDLQTGDKIILPPSALTQIIQVRLPHPFMFKIEGFNSDKISHCGVLQFDAEEGFVHVPDWMMKNLNLREEAHVILRHTRLSRGVFMKLQPHTTSFIELANPKSVLEQGLRGFTCLSRGDTFMIKHGERDFYFDVLEVAPGDAISLIDTDCVLDFAPPLDYKESKMAENVGHLVENVKMFRPFSGRAHRLDGVAAAGGATVEEEGKKRERDGGKKEVFKPFTGRSHILAGQEEDIILDGGQEEDIILDFY